MRCMGTSSAQRQALYQLRQREAGAYRMDAVLSGEARDALAHVVKRDGGTLKAAIERSIVNEAKRDVQQYRHDEPRTDASSPLLPRSECTMSTTTQRPAQMTADEAEDLQRFKKQLQNDRLDARELQINGGQSGLRRKAALNAMLDASNLHRK